MRLYRGQKISRALIDRQRAQDHIAIMDRSSWYLPKDSLLSSLLISTFHLSFLDVDTQKFLDDSTATSNDFCLQAYYALMSTILSFFVSKTSINGILNRGGMFLFSDTQIREFLNIPVEWDFKASKLLDLGAGDGEITKKFSSIYGKIYVTEMSQVMQWRLRQEGFNIVDVERWSSESRRYDLISALNLLDRHYNPQKLLADLHHAALYSNCLVLIGIVLPFKQYVEFHPSKKSSQPDTSLLLRGSSFEEQASSLVELEFIPHGFEVVRWTKLPYLCDGDFNRPFYMLNDAVFLLRAVPIPTNVTHPTSRISSHDEF
uniref:Methyltransferase-like protein 9 n=1 Tax=Heterorhabditis bacteriophora TaxID=37862 RepID=A0A1I7WPJ0_HETBA